MDARELQAAKREFDATLAAIIQSRMEDFFKRTGFAISSIDIDLVPVHPVGEAPFYVLSQISTTFEV